jgi:hypothetical protein
MESPTGDEVYDSIVLAFSASLLAFFSVLSAWPGYGPRRFNGVTTVLYCIRSVGVAAFAAYRITAKGETCTYAQL